LDEHFEKARDLHLTQKFFDDMHKLIRGQNRGPRS
jgi:lysyl-tRNA synthetase class I